MRISLIAALLIVFPALADEAKDPTKSNLPISAKLIAKKTTFKSDISSEELKKILKDTEKGVPPKPPMVELTLEIRNDSKQEVQFWQKGDPVSVTYELKGPGAITITPRLAFTREFRLPVAVKLEPGKTATVPLNGLIGGFRNASQYSYFTDPGEYTLTAKFTTAVKPAPEGVKADEEGFARIVVPSNTITLKVEGK